MANGTAAEKKVPVLLSSIGARTYGLLRSLVSPAVPRDKTLKELEIVLKNHYEPAPLIIAERFQFHRRNQGVGESIAEYVAELRRLSTRCKFDDYLEQALRDRLVCGLRNEGTRKRLLSEADLTSAKALELGFEAAEKNAQQFKDTEVAVHLVAKPKGVHCQRCGRTNHDGADCRMKDVECFNCGKQGHISRVCQAPRRKQSLPTVTCPIDFQSN